MRGRWTKVSSPSSSLTLSTPRCCWSPAHHRGLRHWGSIQLPRHDEGLPGVPEHWPSLDLARTALVPCALGIPEHPVSSQSVSGGPLQPSSPPPRDAPANTEHPNRGQLGSRCPLGSRGGRREQFSHSDAFCFLLLPSRSLPCEPRAGNTLSSPCPHELFLWTWQSPACVSSSPSCEVFLIVTGHKTHAFFLRIADLVKQSGQGCRCGCRSC